MGRTGERIWVPEIIWLWIVNIDDAQVPVYRFRAGSSVPGEALLTFGQNIIEGLFHDLKPAHTQVVFNYICKLEGSSRFLMTAPQYY
ncbi:hypothetical protein SODG_002555 [Sodalis praecaptivus]|uniref:hypothetical protein n=1 Tax=Sodalis praecaptivus TaxID=1239307 RepID=UPI0027F98436|nr:hypothetical protein [Sodalis praecaptivus]CAJ0996789.1 hypothetical protein NVIRENTERO_02557 [Sodalis praecaptivus]